MVINQTNKKYYQILANVTICRKHKACVYLRAFSKQYIYFLTQVIKSKLDTNFLQNTTKALKNH